MKFTATCPRGLEDLVVQELEALELSVTGQTRAAVHFDSDITGAMKACLWLRVANRVLFPLATFEANDPDQLYRAAGAIDWSSHFSHRSTFAIDANVAASHINHSQFASLRVKDAVVDHFRDETGQRPDVDTELPDIRINLHLYKNQATLSLDLSGHSLHQRGYRARMVDAPLKENVAAAMLLRMRWPQIAAEGGSFIDPFCGSGTLMIEAAMIAGDIAPGLLAQHWGFSAWERHKADDWNALVEDALDRADDGLENLPLISGGDSNPQAVAATKANIKAAGLSWKVFVQEANAEQWQAPEEAKTGLILSNPPYGERLGSTPELTPLYMNIGKNFAQQFEGWQLGILTADSGLARATNLRAAKHWAIDNGPIACRLYRMPLEGARVAKAPEALINRLRKNLKHLTRWAKREQIENFRLYDADLPEYASAVDIYQTINGETYAIIQEYAPPASIPEAKAEQRLRETLVAVCEVLDIPPTQARLKTRERQRGKKQYEKQAPRKAKQDGKRVLHLVQEHSPAVSLKLYVNFDDYLDTGLFLDHGPIRKQLQPMCHNKHMLNLFCYTASASVHAAAAGAKSTTSVDMSNTYLEWAERNFTVNNLSLKTNQLIRADVTQWLDEAADKQQSYDVIFCDPPSFSNSKRMEDDFDVQRDHADIINACMKLLAKGGTLIFSCNRRGFKLDESLQNTYQCDDITAKTLAEDFRNKSGKPIHVCFEISHAQ
ncbi:MAG: bifunctional 23S rRNA (guanine(2069)-N(7))-methyltransferase RlmK/23S rRNA (guanine(2445)-N(2))-methyltransferase RlmL [Gammaproteobacteria bacterium]|nr:bifunctional 23S rRNA (guanine(2069)-N(7))-methyltransferase RlmK/23S rRNA (guanine(2445)-N(2))-methyltransferase RlmL [Gammaproteobacteria bacterium]